MRFLPTLALLLLLSAPAYADDFDSLMNLRIYSQAEINLNFAEQLARLVEADEADSVRAVLQGWKDRAGDNHLVQRFDVLWRMQRGEFFSHEIDPDFFENLQRDRAWRRYWNAVENDQGESLARPEYGFPSRFEAVTRSMAERLADELPPDTDAQLVATAYTGRYEYFFDQLRSDASRGTALRELRDAQIQAIHDALEGYYSFFVGYWRPGGGAEPIGAQPSFAVGGRLSGRRLTSGLILGLQPHDLDEEVRLQFPDDSIPTKNAVVLDASVDFGVHVRKGTRATTSVLLGAGVSDLRIFYGDDDPPDAEDLVSAAWSVGVLHRFRWSEFRAHSLELLVRYSVVDYEGAGLNFDGNVLSLMIGYGGASHFDKYRALQSLN